MMSSHKFEDTGTNDYEFAYHVSNIPPDVIKHNGFKSGLGNGATECNAFDELYDADYPKNYLFISQKPWDVGRTEQFKYCYKIDITGLDLYPDFGMLVENGAYYDESDSDDGWTFWWKHGVPSEFKSQKMYDLAKKQDFIMTTNEMMGGETVDGEYFPDALYIALGSAVIDGDIVNKQNRIVDVQHRDLHETQNADVHNSIQGMMTPKSQIEDICWKFIERRIDDNDVDIQVDRLFIHGSRARHTAHQDSDLDVVISYFGDEREDVMFEILNAEPKLKIDNITVDFNPIRPEESGTMDDYIIHSDQYDAEVLKHLNEGLKEKVSFAMLAAMLAVPGLLPAKQLEQKMRSLPKSELKLNSPSMKHIMAIDLDEISGMMNTVNIVNAIAKTIWMEARGEGNEGMDAIASVLLNRAGDDPSNYVKVIREKQQFSGWNGYKGGWTDSTYKYFIPYKEIMNPKSKKIWDYCNELAVKLVKREFKSTIGNRNMIGNPKLDNDTAKNSWGKNCDLNINNHWFGYERCHDGFRHNKTVPAKTLSRTYVIKPGDTLGQIAKTYGKTVAQLVKLNNLKDPNKISAGQILKV